MTTEIETLTPEALFNFMDYTQVSGIWDGRVVSPEEASSFREETENKILNLLFSQNPAAFEKMAHRLAELGEGREIEPLEILPDGAVVPAGFRKSVSKFWHKHKVKILVGIAILAVVTTVAAVAICSTAAAGGAALDNEDKDKKKRPPAPSPSVEANPPPPKPPEPSQTLVQAQAPVVSKEVRLAVENRFPPPSPVSAPQFLQETQLVREGVMKNGQFISFREMLKQENFDKVFPPSPPPAVNTTPLPQTYPEIPKIESPDTSSHRTIGQNLRKFIRENIHIPISEETSHSFRIEGTKHKPHIAIFGINGMNNQLWEAKDSANYLQSMCQGHGIRWTYNSTNTPPIDLLETTCLNFSGWSPNTEGLLMKQWQDFHERNKDRPDAKCLQLGHSQGTCHIYNGLIKSSKEIRDRVIVVAIAPSKVIPPGLCFQAFNYASESDEVPYMELRRNGILLGSDSEHVDILKRRLIEHLVILKPHPDAQGWDHAFQSPTYAGTIQGHVMEYINSIGKK